MSTWQHGANTLAPCQHISRYPGFECNDSPALLTQSRSCLGSIPGDIEKNLRQSLPIAPNGRRRNIVVAKERETNRKLQQQQVGNALEHFMHVDGFDALGCSIGQKQTVDKMLQAIGLFQNDVRRFSVLFTLKIGIKELRRAANTAERIFDFVAEISQELGVCCANVLFDSVALFPKCVVKTDRLQKIAEVRQIRDLLNDKTCERRQRNAHAYGRSHAAVQ